MNRECSDAELSPARSNKRARLDVVVGPPSNFEIFNVSLDVICEHSRRFRNLYCEATIGHGLGKAIMLPNFTPELFRVYFDRLEDSSVDLAQAVEVRPDGVGNVGAADEDPVLKQLHKLCTWWRGADLLEDCQFKNAIIDVLVDRDIGRCPEVLLKLAYPVAGEELKESGLRCWWVDSMAVTLSEDNIDELCREFPKDIVVDLLKAQVRLSKAEDSCNCLRGAERYY
ncbi:hypothetical protein AC579_10093 [Pseudocercospora musae]|uniref:BTB domain-containing protein n=1 Tax=Pseudocercospora musae TaxID=113226 RepID=A0A139IG72_9PEZI|nr:hypothetical protein AC579_10093 [Pseudocercospora musae]